VVPESWLKRRLRTGLVRRPPVPRPLVEPTAVAESLPHTDAPPAVQGQARRLIVCGDDPLAHRLIEELVSRYDVEVTAILPSRRRNHGPQIASLLAHNRGRMVESDRLDSDAFRQANVATADAVALVKQDDVGNIHAALQAQELNPQLRLVIRMFNMRLGHGIRRLFRDCRVLSDASMAAPAFVSAALGEVAPVHIRLARRTLYVARRAEVRAEDIVCGLAATTPDGQTDLLPANQANADLVLAVARGERVTTVMSTHDGQPMSRMVVLRGERGAPRPRRVSPVRRWLRAQRKHPFGAVQTLINRKLRVAALVLVALLVIGTGVLAEVKHIHWWEAAYLTILTTLGGANPDLRAPGLEKITQTVLTIVSIALIPVITAAVVESVVNARLALALGRLREPISDHVIVVGLGNVGTRVMHDLLDLGVPVVTIDKNEAARGAQAARTKGIPFIIGDASQVETLRAASIETCRALVVVSTDDVTNLEAALQGRGLKHDLRVVLRLFDGDFADRVQRAFGITISRSVSYLAAPAFAAALLEREVIGTIPVNRRVLLLAEAPIGAGSALDGGLLSQAHDVDEVRVLALVTDEGRDTMWAPSPSYMIREGDVLIVVATRLGLGQLLVKSGGSGSAEVATADQATAPEVAVTEPALTEPALTEAALTEAALTEAAVTEHAVTEPALTEAE
jgi:Trk K+ transport system NAD-binding subunit